MQTILLLACLLFSSAVSSQTKVHDEKEVVVRGHTVATVDYFTGYLRGGFGDRYEVFVFNVEPGPPNSSVALVKVMYKFFYNTEQPLPNLFFDGLTIYQLQVTRTPDCDETIQSLSYQKNQDITGKPLPSTYILRLLDYSFKDILNRDELLPCYILTANKYKRLDSQQAKSGPSAIRVVGRVLATAGSRMIGTGLEPRYVSFLFGMEEADGGRITPIKVSYAFFQSEGPPPSSFFDYSKRYQLEVVRDTKCDQTFADLAYMKNVDETGKPLPSTFVLNFLPSAPKEIFRPDLNLSCYILRPGKYKLLPRK